jgi:hypothetical protein
LRAFAVDATKGTRTQSTHGSTKLALTIMALMA